MKKPRIKLRVHREIIRTLDETQRSTIFGGAVNCTMATHVASSCMPGMLAPPRED